MARRRATAPAAPQEAQTALPQRQLGHPNEAHTPEPRLGHPLPGRRLRSNLPREDFVHDKLSNGRSYKMLTVLDEFTRQALAVVVRTRWVPTMSSKHSIRSCCAMVPQSISDLITSYVGNFRLFRSAGHGASGKPDALQSLPRRALPSRNDLFHSKHRVRAMAALTVLNTRSHFPSRRPKHYLRGQHTASTAHQREVLPPGLTPSKKGR